jgi:cbb3-type cytochrome oxidase maturation protein
MSTLLVLAILAVFGWALHGGQFDELEQEGERILSEAPDTAANVDLDQALPLTTAEQSRPEYFRL